MKPQAFRTEQANLDLIELWCYIAQDSPNAADRLLDAINEKCEMLAGSPRIGRRREELGADVRTYGVGSYLICYQPIEEGIRVLRVLSGARDLDALF